MLNFIPHNPTRDGNFEKYVLLKEVPQAGSIEGMIQIEGEIDPSWVGKEECVFYVNNEIVFVPNATYELDRKRAYPSITDQLDMLWHAIDSGTLDQSSDFYTALRVVKDQYPKPE